MNPPAARLSHLHRLRVFRSGVVAMAGLLIAAGVLRVDILGTLLIERHGPRQSDGDENDD